MAVQYGQEVGDEHPQVIRGTVIAKRNKSLDSGFTMINVRAVHGAAALLSPASLC